MLCPSGCLRFRLSAVLPGLTRYPSTDSVSPASHCHVCPGVGLFLMHTLNFVDPLRMEGGLIPPDPDIACSGSTMLMGQSLDDLVRSVDILVS